MFEAHSKLAQLVCLLQYVSPERGLLRKQSTSLVLPEVDFSRGNDYIHSSPLALVWSHQQFPFSAMQHIYSN